MKEKEVKTVVFMGGSFDIKNDKNEVVKYDPKVDVSAL